MEKDRRTDFYLEKHLLELDADLHRRMSASVVALPQMLWSYASRFPNFTDHSILHSLDVLEYANLLMGKAQVDCLNAAECYALIMACYLHDMGMGISEADYEAFCPQLDFGSHPPAPGSATSVIVRDHHHEFSGFFIQKYAPVFDIPSPELTQAVAQISRGHRKTDLLDPVGYADIDTDRGRIRTAYLSAIIRLADEIDVAANRNSELLFESDLLPNEFDRDIFGIHESIRAVDVSKDRIVLTVTLKAPKYGPMVNELIDKIQTTLDYCRLTAQKTSDLEITQYQVISEPFRS